LHLGPIQPSRQLHLPDTGSHVAPFSQSHCNAQFGPYRPLEQPKDARTHGRCYFTISIFQLVSLEQRLPCCRHMTYNDRLVKLNIDSLELRRLRLDLVYVYKIMFGLVATDISDYFTLQSANGYSAITRRGNPYKCKKNFSVSASLKYGIVCHQVLLILNHCHRL